LTSDLDLQSQKSYAWSRVTTHTHTRANGQDHSVQKLEWKRTDGQAGGRRDCIMFRANTGSVVIAFFIVHTSQPAATRLVCVCA